MAFPPQFLDEVRARVRLSDIVSRTVKLTRRGREFTGLCPFHNEKTPSFTVSDDKNFYHCFGCGSHGDVIGFVMEQDGLTFPEAVERMAAEAGLEVPVSTPQEREREKRRAELVDVMEAACAFYESKLWSTDDKAALNYLRGRGLTDETIKKYRLGYAPAGNSLKSAIISKEMPEPMLCEGGLVRKPEDGRASYDFFRDRVIFPIADARGRIIAFGGRTMGDGEPKYLNSPDTPLFDKRRTLYGIEHARKAAYDRGRTLVAEGYMDVIALAQAGFAESVAPLGTALTESHVTQLWKLTDEPVLCFDGDKAGQRAAGRVAERALPLLEPGKSLRFVTLPAGEDPDSLVSTQGPTAFEALIEKAMPLDTMIWSMETSGRVIDTPERIAGLEKRLEDRALSIVDRKVQFQYQARFREKLRDMVNTRRTGPGGRGQGRRGFSRDGGWNQGKNPGILGPRTGPDILKKRREQVLLATVINHPGLLDTFAEDLAMINVSDPTLDKLREEILKVHALEEELDSSGLKKHLTSTGNSEILHSVLGSEVYVHAAFARDDASERDVRSGFLETLSRQLQPARRAQLEEARQFFIEDPTDENWERLEKLKSDSSAPGSAAGQA
jgi:DNA primase